MDLENARVVEWWHELGHRYKLMSITLVLQSGEKVRVSAESVTDEMGVDYTPCLRTEVI